MATPTVYTPKRLITPSQLTTSAADLYTVPVSTTTKLTQLILCNTSGAARTATIYLIPGGVAANAYKITSGVPVPSDGTPLTFNFEELYMNASDILSGLASGATSVSIHASGVELT